MQKAQKLLQWRFKGSFRYLGITGSKEKEELRTNQNLFSQLNALSLMGGLGFGNLAGLGNLNNLAGLGNLGNLGNNVGALAAMQAFQQQLFRGTCSMLIDNIFIFPIL